MTWRDAVLNVLMGAPYEEITVVAPTEVLNPLVPAPLDAPQPAMAMQETLIQDMRRAELLTDAPVLSANDAAVRQASFRDRFVAPAKARARARARLQMQADTPVEARPAPLITSSPELERAEKRGIRAEYQSIVPVQRKIA